MLHPQPCEGSAVMINRTVSSSFFALDVTGNLLSKLTSCENETYLEKALSDFRTVKKSLSF